MQAIDNTFSERIPPQNTEAEHSVIGACLIDREAVEKVRSTLKPAHFYADKHKALFEAILRAHDKGGADLITVQDELRRLGDKSHDGETWLDRIGGIGYLTGLINSTPSTANVELYAATVLRTARLRGIQRAARKAVDACYDEVEPDEVMGDLQQSMDKIGRSVSKNGLRPITGRIGNYAKARFENRKLPNADWIPSRFKEIRTKCPFLRREVTLIAMPPGTGKTTYAVSEADFLSEIGYRVAFFELEMPEEQIYDKLIAQAARLSVMDIRMGLLDELEWISFRDWGDKYNQRETLSINSETEETVNNIRWQCLRMAAESGGLDMVIVDFLDRVNIDRERDERYDQLVAKIVGMCKKIARECNCHVQMLAQVDVRVTERADPVPTKKDLANAKTNLAAWPDNIITGIAPHECKGDGKRSTPMIYGIECTDKRFTNMLMLSLAKARFSKPGELVPIYADMRTGLLGSLRKPWPWFKNCTEDMVGRWDHEADEKHKVAMVEFRGRALGVVVEEETEPEDDF